MYGTLSIFFATRQPSVLTLFAAAAVVVSGPHSIGSDLPRKDSEKEEERLAVLPKANSSSPYFRSYLCFLLLLLSPPHSFHTEPHNIFLKLTCKMKREERIRKKSLVIIASRLIMGKMWADIKLEIVVHTRRADGGGFLSSPLPW